MGKYFGYQPRYSQAEAEAQAKAAIDEAVNRGRPPAEEFKPLAGRMGDINHELALRPPEPMIPSPPPRRTEPAAPRPTRVMSQILRPAPAPAEPGPPAPAKRPPRAASPAPAPALPKRTARSTAAPAPAGPAKRARAAAAPPAAAPVKRTTRAAAPAPPAKRPAAKKRPG